MTITDESVEAEQTGEEPGGGLPSVASLLERVTAAERFLNSAREATGLLDPDEILELLEERSGKLDDATRAVEEAKEAVAEAVAEVADAAGPARFRDELGAYVMQLLGSTEFQERPPHWLLDLAERLAGLS